jgi:hypothetical protein
MAAISNAAPSSLRDTALNNLVIDAFGEMSAYGPKQTCPSAPRMSAFGGKADIFASY